MRKALILVCLSYLANRKAKALRDSVLSKVPMSVGDQGPQDVVGCSLQHLMLLFWTTS